MVGLTKTKLFKLPGIWNAQAGNRETSMKTFGTLYGASRAFLTSQ